MYCLYHSSGGTISSLGRSFVSSFAIRIRGLLLSSIDEKEDRVKGKCEQFGHAHESCSSSSRPSRWPCTYYVPFHTTTVRLLQYRLDTKPLALHERQTLTSRASSSVLG